MGTLIPTDGYFGRHGDSTRPKAHSNIPHNTNTNMFLAFSTATIAGWNPFKTS